MRTNNKLNVLNRFNNKPVLVSPNHGESIRALAIVGTTVYESAQAQERAVNAQCAASMGFNITDDRKTFMFSDGLAVIPVYGALLHRDGYCDSYATGYDFIRNRYDAALNDPDVQGIVFDIDSYGGQVAGNFELCQAIYDGRATKPSVAIVDSDAYSGGYSLASAAGKIIAAPSAGVGSIGVVMMHVSIEKMLQDAGVAVTFIYAGKHKVDGNMFQDLSEEAKARFQASVDKSYEKFVALVARNRALDPAAVKATEALTYDVEDALALGLIDGISTSQDALVAFRNELKGSVITKPKPGNKGATKMSTENNQGGDDKTVSAQEHAAAVSAAATTAAADARKSERERINAITSSEEAKDRSKLASHIANNTDMSVDDAKKMLAAAPTEKADKPTGETPFERAMKNGNPEIGVEGGDGGDGGDKKISVGERIVANHQKVTNYGSEKK